MKLTRGEFCQFSVSARCELLKEFGKRVLKRNFDTRQVSIYRIFDFYVEVFEHPESKRVEKVEPLLHRSLLDIFQQVNC